MAKQTEVHGTSSQEGKVRSRLDPISMNRQTGRKEDPGQMESNYNVRYWLDCRKSGEG